MSYANLTRTIWLLKTLNVRAYINNSTGDISLCFSEHLTGRPNNQNKEKPLCQLLFWMIEVGT